MENTYVYYLPCESQSAGCPKDRCIPKLVLSWSTQSRSVFHRFCLCCTIYSHQVFTCATLCKWVF